ncbi:MFS transporter [Catenulispora subtropica]|uniref:MFS transporter n=1 Tax=Catenulispora subtropica TaxID=450798 RepID=A0ABN2R8G2_9ACTN
MGIETTVGPIAPTRNKFLPNRYAFWALAAMLCFLNFANAAPSPLYGLYQHSWKFSPIVLTAVFASSALSLLITLLFVGSLSDHIGRRPVLLAAVAVELVAMVAFDRADGVAWLFAARALQGIAVGAAAGAISAMMLDVQEPGSQLAPLMTNSASAGGSALGALVTGLLVQFAPSPTKLVFQILIVVFLAVFLIICVLPETVVRDSAWRASLPPKVSVPPAVRGSFAALVPCIVATWALGGLYLSLGPSIVAALDPHANHLVGALVILTVNGAAAATAVLVRGWTPEQSFFRGSYALLAGMGLAILAVHQREIVTFFVASAVAGTGFGPSFAGALRTLTGLTPTRSRAEVVTAIYIVAYLGLSLPAVIAGIAITHVGLFPTAYGYGIGVMVLTALAVAATLRSRHRIAAQRARNAQLCGHHDLPPCPGTVPPTLRPTAAAAP